MTAAIAEIGHNSGPIDLRTQLTADFAAMGSRADELLAGVARVPPVIADEEMEKKAIEFVKQIGEHIKVAESAHKTAKAPHLTAGRTVDGFFGNLIQPLTTGKNAVLAKLTEFQTRRAAIERAAREQAEREARELAEKEAASINTEADLAQAIASEETAQVAATAALAPVADLSRQRGTFGSVGSLRSLPKHEITDASLVPREYLMVNDDAIKAVMKGSPKDSEGLPTIKIPGVRIYMERKTQVR